MSLVNVLLDRANVTQGLVLRVQTADLVLNAIEVLL